MPHQSTYTSLTCILGLSTGIFNDSMNSMCLPAGDFRLQTAKEYSFQYCWCATKDEYTHIHILYCMSRCLVLRHDLHRRRVQFCSKQLPGSFLGRLGKFLNNWAKKIGCRKSLEIHEPGVKSLTVQIYIYIYIYIFVVKICLDYCQHRWAAEVTCGERKQDSWDMDASRNWYLPHTQWHKLELVHEWLAIFTLIAIPIDDCTHGNIDYGDVIMEEFFSVSPQTYSLLVNNLALVNLQNTP